MAVVAGPTSAASAAPVAANTAVLQRIAENTKRSADTLRNVSKDGDSLSIESDSILEI